MVLVLLLSLLLSGCQGESCPTFNDLEVTNPDGAAPESIIAEVEAAVDQFAAWTGREGVCVGEARLVPELYTSDGTAAAGLNHDGWIEIDYDSSMHIDGVVYHELCHAVDRVAGWFSETRPDWFPSDEPHEDFAYACEDGPQSISLIEGVEQACGEDLGTSRQRYINTVVYTAAEVPDNPPAGTLPISLERTAIQGLPEHWSYFVPGGSFVYLLSSEAGDDDEVAELVLNEVDPQGAVVVGRYSVVAEDDGDYELLASDDGPLILRTGSPTIAWQLDSQLGELVLVPFPTVQEGAAIEGAVLDGVAWVLTVFAGDDEESFSRVDLQTGEQHSLTWPGGISRWRQVVPDGSGLLGVARDDEDARIWLRYDTTSDAWSWEEDPSGWHETLRITLTDGRVLGRWVDYLAMREFDLGGLAIIDPDSGEWWLADEPCSEDQIGLQVGLLSIDGEPWLWEYSSGFVDGDPFYGQGHALTRVNVGVDDG